MAHLGIILARTDGIGAIEVIEVIEVIGVIDATEDEVDHLVGRIVMGGMRMHMLRAVATETASAKIDMGAAGAVAVVAIVGNVNGTAIVAPGETAVAMMAVDLPDVSATCSMTDEVIDGGEIVTEPSEIEMTIFLRRIDEHVVRHRHLRSENQPQILPISFPFWSARDECPNGTSSHLAMRMSPPNKLSCLACSLCPVRRDNSPWILRSSRRS